MMISYEKAIPANVLAFLVPMDFVIKVIDHLILYEVSSYNWSAFKP